MNLHSIKYRIVDILSLIDVKHHKEESGEQREREQYPLDPFVGLCGRLRQRPVFSRQ